MIGLGSDKNKKHDDDGDGVSEGVDNDGMKL